MPTLCPAKRSGILTQTILLIHSECHIREILDICLSDLGWLIITAKSPLEGLQCAIRVKPNAIIFDVSTSGMNFFAFLKRLEMDPVTADIPLVLIGANTKWLSSLPLQELNILGLLDYANDLTQFRTQLAHLLKR